ncbi:hypothetical protein FRB99_000600 [Tulasnella sp. 403]|nr:hypothetical protein FRB99_000600 [Tulasnella sp. 403]
MECTRSNNGIGSYKDTSTIATVEHILSITSEWVISMKRRQNRATPIYRLPNEILLIILQLCLPSDQFRLPRNHEFSERDYSPSTTTYYTCLLKLCGVAFDWAHLIRDTPSFWVYTSSWDCQSLTDLVLERSGTSLLWVAYNAALTNAPDSAKSMGKYVKAIRRESHRWKTLVIRAQNSPYILSPDSEDLGAAVFPKLSRLLIFTSEYAFQTLPYFFKCGRPPLKYLHVAGMKLDWDRWASYPELEVLRLCNTRRGELEIKYSQLCNIFNTSPSLKALEMLSIFITGIPRNEPSTLSSSPPVLDLLELIHIEPERAIPFLLPHVALHASARVFTIVQFYGRHSVLKTEDACRIVGSLSRRLSALTRPTTPYPSSLSITTGSEEEEYFQIDFWDGTYDITFSSSHNDRSRIDRLVSSVDPELRSKATILDLSLQPPTDGLEHILSAYLPNVVELTVVLFNTVPLDDVCGPYGAPSTQWPFPRMRELCLHFGFSLPYTDVPRAYPAMFPTLYKVAEGRSTLNVTRNENVVALERVEFFGRGKIRKQDVERLEVLVPEVIINERLEIIEEP